MCEDGSDSDAVLYTLMYATNLHSTPLQYVCSIVERDDDANTTLWAVMGVTKTRVKH